MEKSNFALRLQPSLMEEARKAAESEGVALNQLITLPCGEAFGYAPGEYFQERIRRADVRKPCEFWAGPGRQSPVKGDEIPPNSAPDALRAAKTRKPARIPTPQMARLKRLMEKSRGR